MMVQESMVIKRLKAMWVQSNWELWMCVWMEAVMVSVRDCSRKWVCPEQFRSKVVLEFGNEHKSIYFGSTVQYRTVQYRTLQYSTVQSNTVQFSTVVESPWMRNVKLATSIITQHLFWKNYTLHWLLRMVRNNTPIIILMEMMEAFSRYDS